MGALMVEGIVGLLATKPANPDSMWSRTNNSSHLANDMGIGDGVGSSMYGGYRFAEGISATRRRGGGGGMWEGTRSSARTGDGSFRSFSFRRRSSRSCQDQLLRSSSACSSASRSP